MSYAENADITQLAGLYTAAIVQNHPFVDGNKRAGFLAGIMLIEMNEFNFMASEEDVIQTVLALAAGDLDEAGYAAWLGSNVKRRRG